MTACKRGMRTFVLNTLIIEMVGGGWECGTYLVSRTYAHTHTPKNYLVPELCRHSKLTFALGKQFI